MEQFNINFEGCARIYAESAKEARDKFWKQVSKYCPVDAEITEAAIYDENFEPTDF